MDIQLSCTCGALKGIARNVSPRLGNRIVCYCDDCQAYGRFLRRESDLFDAFGGTDIFQLFPSHLTLAEGLENLRCMRLSEKGLLRWYAGCCRTPVANTLASPKIPFAGIPHLFMAPLGALPLRDELLGPIREKVQGRFAPGGLPPGARKTASLKIMARALRLLALGFVQRKHQPSPFFIEGKPRIEPSILTPSGDT